MASTFLFVLVMLMVSANEHFSSAALPDEDFDLSDKIHCKTLQLLMHDPVIRRYQEDDLTITDKHMVILKFSYEITNYLDLVAG